MINAKDAKKITVDAINNGKSRALKWARDELDFISNHIVEAAQGGKFDTAYYWSDAIFAEAKITLSDATEALQVVLGELGYFLEFSKNHGTHGSLKIYINWMEEENE